MKYILRLFLLLACGWVSLSVLAQPGNPSILLRNVSLPDEATGAYKTVNVLVRDNKLDIITEDLIPLDEADEVYDAAGGVILGQLTLGGEASFMVLDGDPRKDIDILLDTKTHATFAMRRGEVVRNRFVMMLEETPEEKKRTQGGWLAYAPPPLAVPLDYTNTNKWNRFDTRFVSGIAAGALALDRQTWVDQDNASRNQVGDLDEFEGGEIRALRFGAVGTINFDKPWIWTLFGATHAFDQGFDSQEDDDFTFFDVRLDIPLWQKASFSIGKQKEPISMERMMGMTDMPQQERSAVADALLPSRNIGLVMAGSLFNDRLALAAGGFNNWLDKDQPNSFSDNSTQYVGRATWVPYQSDNESTLLHLGAGIRYSDTEEKFAIATEPEFNQSPDFISTDTLLADGADTYQAEASLRSGPFWLHSEYIESQIDNPLLLDPTARGYHVTASWLMTGEVRPYNKRVGIFGKIPISRTVHQNGWGAWEISARYSNFDANDGRLFGGELDIWSAGINWWLSPYFNVNMNYRYITLEDGDGIEGTSQGFSTRLLLILE
ncbi:MAG: porin [Halieaceae bacterium]